LQLLEDNHSFISKTNGRFISGSSIFCGPSDLSPVPTPDNVGYIKINSFSGNDQSESLAFAENIQNEIRVQDSENISGWIVDLRNNPGGNMWPMLAGLGPVLGEGIAGYFIDPDNESTAWSYANGAAISGQNTKANVTSAYTLLNSDSKVAVLLNRAVISSGEAIAISFIGRSNTETFGEATCGLSTANSGFSLSDGSTLFLTTAFMADRNQNVYGESILPDNVVSDGELIQAAIDYINN
jgi:C-terminal processing protease CtpA/Prc